MAKHKSGELRCPATALIDGIIDELTAIYLHQIDHLIAEACENRNQLIQFSE